MAELRYIDTNSANDSDGRAFGLDGNLYLPVVCAVIGALGAFAALVLGLGLHVLPAGLVVGVPVSAVIAWAVVLRNGRPAGFDVDWCEQLLWGADMSRRMEDQDA